MFSVEPDATQSNLVGSLVFGGTIHLCITLAESDIPSTARRLVESYHIQVPRISYLPLLIPSIREHLVNLCLSPPSSQSSENDGKDAEEDGLLGIKDDEIWFDYEGIVLRWQWSIGLLYDYHASNSRLARFSSTSPTTSCFSLTMHIARLPSEPHYAAQLATISGSSIEGCKIAFMNRVKEADFLRWGSVKRVTNLRKEQQDALWEGVVHHDYQQFRLVAAKLLSPPSTSQRASPQSRPTGLTSSSLVSPSVPSAHPRSLSSTASRSKLSESMRNVPLRVYLPDPSAPVFQDAVTIFTHDGAPTTLLCHLHQLLPLLFPRMLPPGSDGGVLADQPTNLASILSHGIIIPLETELQWLASYLTGADGWINLVIVPRS